MNERKVLIELQSIISIVALTVDKDRATVILCCEDYLENCIDHINNSLNQFFEKDLTNNFKAMTLIQGLSKNMIC